MEVAWEATWESSGKSSVSQQSLCTELERIQPRVSSIVQGQRHRTHHYRSRCLFAERPSIACLAYYWPAIRISHTVAVVQYLLLPATCSTARCHIMGKHLPTVQFQVGAIGLILIASAEAVTDKFAKEYVSVSHQGVSKRVHQYAANRFKPRWSAWIAVECVPEQDW